MKAPRVFHHDEGGGHGHHHHPHDQHHHGGDRPRRPRIEDDARGRDKVLFLDTFSGIAGDMLVAALLDLGIPRAVLDRALAALPLSGYRIEVSRASRSGIVATRFQVHLEEPQPQRTYAQIREMLDAADLETGVRDRAQRAFRLLAEAEADVHGSSPEEVHFHEVGAVDSIVDIVAAVAGLEWLGARIVCSPLPMGKGFIEAQHGVLPLPAPATVSCLRGAPTYDAGIDGELVTPTGACLVASSTDEFRRWPPLRPERVGWGAGTREWPDRPNLLRLVLGRGVEEPLGDEAPLAVLETNVDDLTPEIATHAMERVLEAGALDAWTGPIGMKKGRPALMISALVRKFEVETITHTLLAETTTLGVRIRPAWRIERPRRIETVETPYGPIAVKVADGDGLPANFAPEFEACRTAALEHRVSAKEVYAAALAAARRSGKDDR